MQKKRENALSVLGKQKASLVVEEDADAVIAELVAKAVLVRVVHPLGNPENGRCSRVQDSLLCRVIAKVMLCYVVLRITISYEDIMPNQELYRTPLAPGCKIL